MADPQQPSQPQTGGQPTSVPPESPATSESVDDRLSRLRFWAIFASAAAVLAAILGIVALVAAINAKDDESTTDQNVSAQVAQLRTDVDELKKNMASAAAASTQASEDARSLRSRVGKVEKQLATTEDDVQQNTDDIAELRTDLQDLTDRVDQIEREVEREAAGGN